MEPVAAARIAAALVYKREIISIGICQYKTHPFQKEYGDPKAEYFHAETHAINNAANVYRIDKEIIQKSILYVARQRIIKNEWTTGLAKPCSGCSRCVKDFNIKQIIFSLNDEGYGVLDRE